MWACYVDEAGCLGALPSATSPIQPAFVICGLALKQENLRQLTLEFLFLKQRFFPRLSTADHLLDRVLTEIKGADLRTKVRKGSRRARRHAIGFLDHVMRLVEKHDGYLFGRVWIKPISGPFDGTAVYTSSVQRICECFQHLLKTQNDGGIVIADSRTKAQNTNVAHSIFTEKFRSAGDRCPNILEMPTFGHSDNHGGLQLVDLLCSAIIFPLAVHAYCLNHVTNIHVHANYSLLRPHFCQRLKARQPRYQENGQWRGGITTCDSIGQRPGRLLF